MKRIGWIVFLIVVVFFAFGIYRAFNPPRVGGVAFSQLPPETQQERRVEAQKLVEQVEEVGKASRSNEKKPFTLTANEDQLNTLLQDRLRTEKFAIRDLRAGLTPGQITLQGTGQYKGFDVPATLVGSLTAQNGALVFAVDSLTLGGLPAPGDLKDKAQRAIEDGLQKGFAGGKNGRVEQVDIGTGQMTITGTTG